MSLDLTSKKINNAVKFTCNNCTFNYDFWTREKIHPQRKPKVLQQLDKDQLDPFFKSVQEALLKNHDFPEPDLNEFQLHSSGEIMEHLSYKAH